MKKFVSIFLVLALIIFQVDTAKVFADTQSGDFKYIVSGTFATITGYTGSGGNVIIPDKIDGYAVTNIGNFAFWGCSNLTNITIPNTVTIIDNLAFASCSSLTNITIPNSVTSISYNAFNYCSKLNQINVNTDNTTYSDLDGVLYNKDKTTLISYPSGKTDSTYIIPKSVTSISPNTFNYCSKLSQINVNTDNTTYSDLDGVLYNKDKTTLISYPGGKTDSKFIIPTSVTTICGDAFNYCFSLTNITVPNSVTSIDFAFRGCSNLTSINIPNSITSIGDYAFQGCSSLTSITIPDNITSIGNYAFSGCSSLTNINIPKSITNIGNDTFYGCSSLTSITIPTSVTSIGNYAFENCSSTFTIYYHNTAIGFTNPWNGFKTVAGNIVSYNGNGNISGTVPVDNNVYASESKASILNNTGNLVKTGYVFAGWNTAANGSGISYPTGTSISINGSDITLYAQWKSQIISPITGTFTKAAPNNLTTIITAPNKAANPVIGVYNGSTRLICGTDQVISPTASGYTLTLYKSYLSKLTSNAVITVKFKDGSSLNYNVVLIASISPTTGTFTKSAPSNLTTVITAPYKAANPVTGVYNGATRLICGTDQVISPTATGYTLTLYKSYLSKLTSNAVISVKFKDGSSLNYTVNIK